MTLTPEDPQPVKQYPPIVGVLVSRKFWFAFVVPILISTAAVLLKVIEPVQYIAAVTATSSLYGATVAYEDAHTAA